MTLLYPFLAFFDFFSSILSSDLVKLVIFTYVLYRCCVIPFYDFLGVKN